MPKISTYTTVTPQGNDKIIVTQTSGTPTDVTKNITIDGLKTFIKGIFPFLFNTTSLTGIQSSGNTASGNRSTAMGENTTASGTSSTAMGNETEAVGASSTAMGESTTASGDYSTVMGQNTTASGESSTAMGQYNVLNTGDNPTSYDATNTAFSVGNGTSEGSRSDAFKVLFNGTTTIAGSLTSESLNVPALNTAPASATSAGTLGSIRFTADYIYVCVATNTWKRVAVVTF